MKFKSLPQIDKFNNREMAWPIDSFYNFFGLFDSLVNKGNIDTEGIKQQLIGASLCYGSLNVKNTFKNYVPGNDENILLEMRYICNILDWVNKGVQNGKSSRDLISCISDGIEPLFQEVIKDPNNRRIFDAISDFRGCDNFGELKSNYPFFGWKVEMTFRDSGYDEKFKNRFYGLESNLNRNAVDILSEELLEQEQIIIGAFPKTIIVGDVSCNNNAGVAHLDSSDMEKDNYSMDPYDNRGPSN
ncbi:MAG: hypothetical protein KJ674_00230 [Nanoarchaeota archaeon]|nr:hypothetical protein [Nanoarchaeota archaeon]